MAYQVNVMYKFIWAIILIIVAIVSGGPFMASFPLIIVGAVKKKKPMLIIGIILHVTSWVEIIVFGSLFAIAMVRGI